MFRKIIDFSLLFYLIAALLVAYQSLTDASTILITFILLSFLGLALSFKGVNKSIFLLSFSINSIFAVVFYNYFNHINGVPFIGGGDDELFYNFILRTFNKGFTFGGFNILFFRFWLFIYVYFHFAEALNIIGIWDQHLLHLIFLSAFFGAFTNVFIYKIAKTVFNRSVAEKATIYNIVFTYLIFNYCTFLRETMVIFLLYFSLALLVSKSKLNKVYKFLAIIPAILSTTGIRLETGFPNVFIVLYGWITSSRFLRVLAVSVFLIIAYQFGPTLYEKRYLSMEESYTEYLNETIKTQSGLGSKLAVYKDHPIGMVAYSFLAIFNPIPPIPRFFRLDDVFIGLSSIWWYFIIPIAFIGLYKYDKDVKFKIYALIVLFFFFFISYKLQGGIRHRIPLMPMVLLFYCYGAETIDKIKLHNIRVYTFCIVLLALFPYVFLKLIL